MTDQAAEPIWVNTGEGSEITGYNQQYLKKLANKLSQLPESERPIKIRSRARHYELWLPDLIAYIAEKGHGPRKGE